MILAGSIESETRPLAMRTALSRDTYNRTANFFVCLTNEKGAEGVWWCGWCTAPLGVGER